MQMPLEIATAPGVTLTPELRAEIQEKADGLQKFYSRIIRCRVSIEREGHQRNGDYGVHILLTVPGNELVVAEQAKTQLLLAVRDSFHTARRQLEDYARYQRGD